MSAFALVKSSHVTLFQSNFYLFQCRSKRVIVACDHAQWDIYSVGLPRASDRLVAEVCIYTTHNNRKRRTSKSPSRIRIRDPSSWTGTDPVLSATQSQAVARRHLVCTGTDIISSSQQTCSQLHYIFCPVGPRDKWVRIIVIGRSLSPW